MRDANEALHIGARGPKTLTAGKDRREVDAEKGWGPRVGNLSRVRDSPHVCRLHYACAADSQGCCVV